jgi:DNA mismatch repair protein MutL
VEEKVMSEIKLLSEDLINKIAAGEVIERPASVVKELVENSIDAGATNILIEITDSGKKLIKVLDNGKGMSKEDAEKAVLRHATSKIKTAEDLFAIQTLGFRGEALASIAAVSNLSITTKQKGQIEGFQILINGGLVINSNVVASDEGTIVEIKNLFFNTPARKKFLKTDAVELRHIIDVVTKYSLLHNAVGFKLIHEGREIINSPVVVNLRNNIATIYGFEVAKELIDINYEDDNLKLSGLVVKPYHARNDKNWQTIFVNGRWVKNEDITNAVYDAYHSILFINKHPVFVLNLEVDPQKIDVNVHPTKSDIKIEKKELICGAVTKAIRVALSNENLLPEVDLEMQEQESFGTPIRKVNSPPKYAFDQSQQMILKKIFVANMNNGNGGSYVMPLKKEAVVVPKQNYVEELQKHSKLPPLKLLGQIHKTFFVAETISGMFFIDQHAVHERVLYEQFMEQLMDGKVEIQNLLKPEVLEFSTADMEIVKENLKSFKKLGFEMAEFGANSFVAKTVPAIFGRLQVKEMVYEILEKWNGIEEKKEEIVTRMACRSAVMAGDELTILEMDGILKELAKKDLPYACPHGRPTMIKVGVDELEKKFRRKV